MASYQRRTPLFLTRTLAAGVLVCCSDIALAHESAVATQKQTTEFENIWRHAILYQNTDDNALLRNLKLSGRAQGDAVWLDADEGDYDHVLWRRFRFGFTADFANHWSSQLEAELDLNNDDAEDIYQRLTDAYIGWNPSEELDVRILKHSAGFTLDGATSSKALLTLERNNLTNNLWFTTEYFSGISAKGKLQNGLIYRTGIFSNDGSHEISTLDAKYFTLTSLGYDFANQFNSLTTARLRVEYVYNEEDENADTRPFTHVVSVIGKLGNGDWGVWSDISAGSGYHEQSDIWGVSVMPFYNSSKLLQWVFRYTYLSSNDDNGIRLDRYENETVSGRGDEYNEYYAGLNVLFYGDKLKWQSGVKYTRMDDAADDGGRYDGVGFSTGLRIYW